MNKNILFVYKKLLNNNKNFYISYFRIFLIFYSKHYLLIDNLNLNNSKSKIINYNSLSKLNTTFKNYIKNNSKNNSLNIIFFNNLYIYSNNFDLFLFIKIINNQNYNYLNLFNNFYFELFNNLSFVYIINLIFSINNYSINIYNNIINKNIFIFNLFNFEIINNFLSIKKYILINKNIKCNIIEFFFNDFNKIILNINMFFKLNNNTILNYYLISDFKNNGYNYITFFFKHYFNNILNFIDIYLNQTYSFVTINSFLIGKHTRFNKKSIKISKFHFIDKFIYNIYHYNDSTQSNVFFISLSNNTSKLIFIGNIIVGNKIKHINANLKCEGLMLSNSSIIQFDPNMFINSNDVQCFHGASIGCVNNTILKYMTSRGLDLNECKKIIIISFLNKILNTNDINISILKNNLKFNNIK